VISDLVLTAPLPVPPEGALDLLVTLDPAAETGLRTVTVHARPPGGDWTAHASGALGSTPASPPAAVMAWPPDGAEPVQDLAAAYAQLAARGYQYGPAFRGLRAMWRRGRETFAEVALPDLTTGEAAGLRPGTAHPALVDAALHPALMHAESGLAVPFSWQGVSVPLATAGRVLRVRTEHGPDAITLDFFGADGQPAGRVKSLGLRPLAQLPDAASGAVAGLRSAAGSSPAQVFAAGGAARAAGAAGAAGATEATEAARSLELAWEQLADDGDPLPPAAWWSVGASELAAGRAFPSVDAFPGLDGAGGPPPACVVASLSGAGAQDAAAAEQLAVSAAGLIRRWLADPAPRDSRLVLLTHGAVAAAGREPIRDLAASVVTGLVRAAQAEHPRALALVDTDDEPASREALARALGRDEPEIVIRDGRLYRPRLRPALTDQLTPPDSAAWRLDVTAKGTLDNLALIPHPAASEPLGPRQVRIAVRAAGLNFRDITVGLGLVATEKTMGSEGAGVVTEVGSAVRRFAPGDLVFGMIESSLGPVAVTDERTIKLLPAGWSLAEAASVPIVFITAYQCLVDVAAVKPGESVLVHAATGGVGLAAIQLARHFGAEVFATAGPGKQAILRQLGIPADHIASSRSVDFAGQFRAASGGRGVDVVLNSLAGDATDASLGLLAGGGRFAEMGKTDLRNPARVAGEYPGVTYRAYNILGESPDRISEVLDDLIALFTGGRLAHLPLRAWDVRDGATPLRMLSRARHRGKLVLTMPRTLDLAAPVLITGGAGGLAAELARHLARAHGVRRLVLASRRGPAAPQAAALRAELAAEGALVTAVACDVTDRAALAAIIAEQSPGSVFHAAGILSDALLRRMTDDQLRAVLRPKVAGAWHLHTLTGHLHLSAFVLFSSVAGIVGSPGQANYAAANTYLDALAAHRRSVGLEATSLAWGLWEAGTEMTARLSATEIAALARIGTAPMDTASGLRLLDENLATAAAIRVPVRAVPAGPPAGSRAAWLFDGLRDAARPEQAMREQAMGEQATAGPTPTPPDPGNGQEQPLPGTGGELTLLVRAHAAEVLGYGEPAAVGPDDSFRELGFDSLLSVDLRNRLNAATGLRLPPEAVLDHATPRKLADFISIRLDGT
jgi:NADPH:quinone reductase-like Zn-dependent oxidoreductase/NADP-dependent 3-hydroxy acid dehydrogenase YdfG/acyl carrier protein